MPYWITIINRNKMDELKQTQHNAAAARLAGKFRKKTYYESMRAVYHVVFGVSFAFNFLSAVTAAALVYFFLSAIMPTFPAVVLTAVVLFALEAVKRLTAARVFIAHVTGAGVDALAVVVVAVLSSASIASSYKGAERIIVEYTPPPAAVDRSAADGLKKQLADIDEQIRAQRKNTWRGKLTVEAARTVRSLTNARERVQLALVDETARVSEKNETVQTAHAAGVLTNAHLFALFTLACELLFFAAAYWLEYYDFRSYVEFNGAIKNPSTATEPAPVAIPDGVLTNANHTHTARVVAGGARTCRHCGAGYNPRHAKQKYCTDKCRLNAWHAANGRPVARNGAG